MHIVLCKKNSFPVVQTSPCSTGHLQVVYLKQMSTNIHTQIITHSNITDECYISFIFAQTTLNNIGSTPRIATRLYSINLKKGSRWYYSV